MKEITIDSSSSNQRVDRFLRKHFKHTPEIGLGDIFSWIRKWSIKVNMKKTKENYRLVEWDLIHRDKNIITNKKAGKVMQKKQAKINEISLEYIQKLLIDENEHYLIWDKPAHMLIHPWDKHTQDITMHDIMVSYLHQSKQRNATQTYSPSFCYRLDKDTSGVVISAKTYESLQYLNKLIRERQTKKFYHAIVIWNIHDSQYLDKNFVTTTEDSVSIAAPLFIWYNRSTWRSQSFVNEEKWKEARTDFTTIKTIKHPILWTISLLKIKIHSWRMHQIRVHAAYCGFPIVWDLTYGNMALNRLASKKCSITRQLLHASSYWFFDQFTHTSVHCESALPEEFTTLFPQY